MKKLNNLLSTVLILLVVLLSKSISAQIVTTQTEIKNRDGVVLNLIKGIESHNYGLRQSCIFLAGKYSVQETVPALIESLDNETDPEMKILIVRSLNEISDEKGFEAIRQLASKDSNPRVRKISTLVFDEYVKRTSDKTVSVETIIAK